MTHTIAIALQKGGAGKTTTTAALGSELTARGASVLMIDLDPQANLTQALGVALADDAPTVYELLINGARALPVVTVGTPYGCLIPASIDLAGAEMGLAGRIGRELLLRQALDQVADGDYDYILIDTPPTLGLLTANALVAAESILIPLQAHFFALKALVQLDETIALVRPLNPGLSIGGIVLTMVDRRTQVAAAISDAARSRYGDLVFDSEIPMSVRLVEAPARGCPISAYAPQSSGAEAYRALADEVMARWPMMTRSESHADA
jgi:chromosome partitioning protein